MTRILERSFWLSDYDESLIMRVSSGGLSSGACPVNQLNCSQLLQSVTDYNDDFNSYGDFQVEISRNESSLLQLQTRPKFTNEKKNDYNRLIWDDQSKMESNWPGLLMEARFGLSTSVNLVNESRLKLSAVEFKSVNGLLLDPQRESPNYAF